MKRTLLLTTIISIFLISCGATKKPVERKTPTTTVKATENLRKLESNFQGKISSKLTELINDSEKYLGAPYKYGGTTSSGFDCSGFTGKVFEENKIKIPRVSRDQSQQGEEIAVKNMRPGDLIFFATMGGTRVSHVGIVHDIGEDGEIKFIHASSSKGVTISSLNEKYWNKAFLFSRRIENF